MISIYFPPNNKLTILSGIIKLFIESSSSDKKGFIILRLVNQAYIYGVTSIFVVLI